MQSIPPHSPPFATWSSRQFSRAKQFVQWREAVCSTHLAWDMPARREPEFTALVRRRTIAAASLIECVCDPCAGRRGRAEISDTPEAYYGVLHLLRGRERVRQAGRETWLEAGDFLLWDSTRPIDFTIDGTLHKVTLLVPQVALDRILNDAASHVIRPVRGGRGCAALFVSHLRLLAAEGLQVAQPVESTLLDGTLELLSSALHEAASGGVRTRHQTLLQRAQRYILMNLADAELAPRGIARALGTSVRQLHRSFEGLELTLDKWMWRERLQRCHGEIVGSNALTLSQIAFKWGFSDAAHFSRSYHAAFGVSPRTARQQAQRASSANPRPS